MKPRINTLLQLESLDFLPSLMPKKLNQYPSGNSLREKTSQLSAVPYRIQSTHTLDPEKETPFLASIAYHATCLPNHYLTGWAVGGQILKVLDEESVLHPFHLNVPLERNLMALEPEYKYVQLNTMSTCHSQIMCITINNRLQL